jgi:hypothetical protein
VEQEAELKK